MKIYLLLLSLYCTSAAAQPLKQSAENNAVISTDEFCKMLTEVADMASQNKLSALKLGKFKSVFYNSSTSYNSAKNIPTAIEDFIDDDAEFGLIKFEALLKNYDTDANSAKTDFIVMVKKIEDCLGKKASIPSAKGLEGFIHYNNCKVTITTFFSNNISQWINAIILENEL